MDYSELTDLTKVNCVNLDQLIETMKLNKKQIAMESWMSVIEKDHKKRKKLLGLNYADKLVQHCGTTACAAGWCAVLRKDHIDDIGIPTFETFTGISYELSSDICAKEEFYDVHDLEDVTPEQVITVLKDILSQALKAQNIKLVAA